MKNFIIITIALLLTQHLSAQKTLRLGLETGLHNTGIENQNPYGIEKVPAVNTIGLSQAIVLSIPTKKNLDIELGLAYAQYGQNYLDVRNQGDYLRNIHLDYIQLPIMLRRDYGKRLVKVSTGIGVYGSYLASNLFEESIVNSETGKVNQMNSIRNSDRFTRIDAGLKARLGGSIIFQEIYRVSMYYSLSYGFVDLNTDAYKYEPAYKIDYKKSKNISQGFILSISRNLGKS